MAARPSDADRFWGRVERRDDGHWICRAPDGAVARLVYFRGRKTTATRAAYLLRFGELGPEEVARRACEVGGCVRHLEAAAIRARDPLSSWRKRGPARPRRDPSGAMTAEQRAEVTAGWLLGELPRHVADRIGVDRRRVSDFYAWLRKRGGWYTLVHGGACLACGKPFASQQANARGHEVCMIRRTVRAQGRRTGWRR